MSGISAGISKAFTAVSTAAVRVGTAVAGVGASVFSAGAATGAGSMASGGLTGVLQSVAGNGVLGNMLAGAVKTALPGAIIGGIVGGMTGQGVMKGAMMGGLGGAVTGAIGAGAVALSPTGPQPSPIGQPPIPGIQQSTGVPAAAAPANSVAAATGGVTAAAGVPQSNGFSNFLNSDTASSLLSGVGEGMQEQAKLDALAEQNQKARDFAKANQDRVTASYDMSPGALNRGRFAYDPQSGRVIQQ